MGFTANLNQVHAVHKYEDADWFFNKTTPVRSVKWDEDQRPLGRRTAWHYSPARARTRRSLL